MNIAETILSQGDEAATAVIHGGRGEKPKLKEMLLDRITRNNRRPE